LSLLVEEKRLAIPYAFSFAERLTVGFFIGVFPVMMATKFGANPGQIGMLQAAFLVLLSLFSPLGGFLSDRWGRTWPLVLATVFYGGVLWVVGLADQSTLYFVMALGGLSGAILYPATVALTGDLAPPDKRGVAMGGFNTFGSVGMALGPVLLGFIGDVVNLSTSSAVAGITCVVVALVSLPFLLRMRRATLARL
jgi:MFS family permease